MVIKVKVHRVEEGDTLDALASQYGSTSKEIASLSSLRTNWLGPVGSTILVPNNEE